MADIPWDIPRLTAIRNAVVKAPEVASAGLVNFPAEKPDGEFRVTLNDATVVQVDMTITGRPGAEFAPVDLPAEDGEWPKSKLTAEEILRRLAVVGEGDPGHGYRLLMVQTERCSNCCKHRNLCRCWKPRTAAATAGNTDNNPSAESAGKDGNDA